MWHWGWDFGDAQVEVVGILVDYLGMLMFVFLQVGVCIMPSRWIEYCAVAPGVGTAVDQDLALWF